ncbi:MAG: oxygenase MpaB family protein [Pseudomonadota bacterium]
MRSLSVALLLCALSAAPVLQAGTPDDDAMPVEPPAAEPVAPAGDGPLPAFAADWITGAEFERQLEKVHGGIPDPETGLFGPDSMMWRITRYIEPGGLATGRAILMHVSHPWIAQGIGDHSKSRHSLLERGRDTFSYALIMVYGNREQALQAARDVRLQHDRVQGRMPHAAGAFAAGSEYRANEAGAMLWVHATMWESMMIGYELMNGPVSAADKDRFYEETKLFAFLFGIPETALPENWDAMIRFCEDFRHSDRMTITPEAKDLVKFLYGSHGVLMWLPMKYNKLVTTANIPPELREAYGFKWGPVRSVVYDVSIDTIKVAHWALPNVLLENPVRREALARIRGQRAGWFTRLELRLALGRSRLVGIEETE